MLSLTCAEFRKASREERLLFLLTELQRLPTFDHREGQTSPGIVGTVPAAAVEAVQASLLDFYGCKAEKVETIKITAWNPSERPDHY